MRDLLLISNKRYKTDFRKYMMRAAETSGARALHIYAWEKLIFSYGGAEQLELPISISHESLAEAVKSLVSLNSCIGLTGLGGCEVPSISNFCLAHPEVRWIYDVYDDLNYGAKGVELLVRLTQDAMWVNRCRGVIVLDPGLQERYPNSFHLDNASHLGMRQSPSKNRKPRLIYIGSIDSRVDILWLEKAASLGFPLDIWGAVHCSAPDMEQKISVLVSKYENVALYPGYDNDELSELLSGYDVGLIPYAVGSEMTSHVNPDKLHHYLNFGLSVVSSPIPAALRKQEYIRLASVSDDWSNIVDEVLAAGKIDAWPRDMYTWDARWSELLSISEKL